MKDWRKELQDQIDANNAFRSQSVRRIGDHITEYQPCTEGAGRAREGERK